jgi:hypothetical protein
MTQVQEESVEQTQALFQCPNANCLCVFVSAVDLYLHLTVPGACKARMDKLGWRPSDFDKSGRTEWRFANEDPQLALAVRQNGGKLSIGDDSTIILSADGKYLKKVRKDHE